MPRTARLTYPGGFYHIFNRGLNKQVIFPEPSDYDKLLCKLSDLLSEGDWIVYAYCLMPNHYHLLVEEKSIPIAKLIGRLFTSYGVYFNKKYKRQGTLFQDRFKSKLIQKDNYFLEVSRYIHLNPVKANLVNNPEEYNHSSLREYIGRGKRSIINLEKVNKLIGDSKSKIPDYLQFVIDGIKLDLDEYDPFLNEKEIIGSKIFSSNRKRRHHS